MDINDLYELIVILIMPGLAWLIVSYFMISEDKWLWRKFLELLAKIPFLKIAYSIIALFLLYHLIEIFFNLREQLFSNIATLTDDQVRNLAIAFLGTITGIGALFGVYLAILRSEENKRQNDVAEQGLITDRINKAVEGLGKSDKDGAVFEVRLGALYALERIAQDSLRDHIQIMDILCAYIRNNSPRKDKTIEADNPDPLSEDILAAITIVGRRGNWLGSDKYLKKEKKEGYQINLCNCDLHGAQLDNANLSDARLNDTNMSGAQLNKAKLRNASFEYSNLNSARLYYADLRDAELRHATLIYASLNNTNMSSTKLYYTDFSNARISWANLNEVRFLETNVSKANMNRSYTYKADLSSCENLTQEQLDEMFCGKEVDIPKGLTRPSHWPRRKLYYILFKRAYTKWWYR